MANKKTLSYNQAEILENDPSVIINGYNPYLISAIQPTGNLTTHDERYIKSGIAYMCCVEIYEFPGEVTRFWIRQMTGMNAGSASIYDAIFTLDIGTLDKDKAKKRIDHSISELQSRNDQIASEYKETEYHLVQLDALMTRLTQQNEIIKTMQPRVYVYGTSPQEVEQKVIMLLKVLDSNGFKASVFLHETHSQYTALFNPITVQENDIGHRRPLGVTAHCTAIGYPYNTERLDDPRGIYLGYTATGGNVFFDLFNKTRTRLSFGAIVAGALGAGKSTLLKLLMKKHALLGDYIRVLDVSGEFTQLCNALGGIVVTMDGSEGGINYAEVFASAEDNATNFSMHLSKLHNLYNYLAPTAPPEDAEMFESYARMLYEKWGLWGPSVGDNMQITGLNPDVYPTLGDLLQLIQEDLYIIDSHGNYTFNPNLPEGKRAMLQRIELNLGNLVHNFGQIFNTHTSLPNLTNQQIIVYNVSTLTSMKEGVFNAQLFNILSLMLQDMIRIGSISKVQIESGVSIENVHKVLLIVDEAHRFINTRNTLVLKFVTDVARIARKYLTAPILASQNIRDFAPDSTDTSAMEALKVLFELLQYKFIMRQDSNTKSLLSTIFHGEFTAGQINAIPDFQQGNAYLLGTGSLINLKIDITPEEEKLFQGGV